RGSFLAALTLVAMSLPCAAQVFRSPVEAFTPDTILAAPETPRLIRLPAPGAPLVALRLSIPLSEGPADAGAGRILYTLAVRRTRSLAGPTNARIEGSRTPWGISYTVVGSRTDVDYLAYLLREAVAEPRGMDVEFRQVRDDILGTIERRGETPGGRIAGLLRDRVAPTTPPLDGSNASLSLLTPDRIRQVWARTHQPQRMTLVVAGDVAVEVLLASFRDIGAPPSEVTVADTPLPPGTDRSRPEIIRHWYGEVRPFADSWDPHAEVVARLVAETIRTTGGNYEAEVQVWETATGKFLAVVGAAYPAQANAMRQGIRQILSTTRESLTEEGVARAVDTVLEQLLMGARTPGGRATLVGRHFDATGEPRAVAQYLGALSAVSVSSVQSGLALLAATEPVQAEVRP
ncbi:MAG TPA: hypothetical protein VGA70_10640, partial [Longimicrobiales bacterium]